MTVQEALELLKADSVGWIHHPSECSFTRTDVLKVAMECMEKQIPKKPIAKETKYTTISLCPICESTEIDDYCEKCGQAIDWSEEDV